MGRFINIFFGPGGLSMFVTGAPFVQACQANPAFVLLLDGVLDVNGGNLSSSQLGYYVAEPDIKYIPDRNSRGIVVNVPQDFIREADDSIDAPNESQIRTLREKDLVMLEQYFEVLSDERQGSDLDGSTVSLINALLVRLVRILG